MFLALAVRSDYDSLLRIGLLSNKPMLAAISLTFCLQLGVVYLPFLHDLFHTVPLTAKDLSIALVLSTVVFWAVELRKLISRRRMNTGKENGQRTGGSTAADGGCRGGSAAYG